MSDSIWRWATVSPWRQFGIFFALGAVTAAAFFWNYQHSPAYAFFDAVFAIAFLPAAGSYLLDALSR
jgi:hypothetical protein